MFSRWFQRTIPARYLNAGLLLLAFFVGATGQASPHGSEFGRKHLCQSVFLDQHELKRVRYDQSKVIRAQEQGQSLEFVKIEGAEVVKILPDNPHGRRHQKFLVRLQNDSHVMAIYNLSLGERVPVAEGDRVNLAGEYIWDNRGGLIHWLHGDPKRIRPNGFVELDGHRYGNVPALH
jgi:hypothetical protein